MMIDVITNGIYNRTEPGNPSFKWRLRTMKKKTGLAKWEKEYSFIKGHATTNKMRNTLIALSLAVKYHKGQCRDGGEPYIIHPLMVCKSLMLLNIEKNLKEWHPEKEEKWSMHECDIVYAAAILHDVIEDCELPNKGKELVSEYHLEKEVLEVVMLLTKPPKHKKRLWSQSYDEEVYYERIALNWKATLIKISDRANNCSTMVVFDEDRLRKYIIETKNKIYPLAEKGKIKYPAISDTIIILENLIVSICETIASMLGMQKVFVDENEKYKKMVHFIEGAARNNMPNTYKALILAQKFHASHTRTSGDPFIIHPLRVCSYLMSLDAGDDYTYAASLLHEIPQKTETHESGIKLIKKYGLDQEVINVVELVSNKEQSLKDYYSKIEKNERALLEKLSNRVHTCTLLANASKTENISYIQETKKYMVPMCKNGMLYYPQYANQIEIMQSHIMAISNVVEVLTKKRNW